MLSLVNALCVSIVATVMWHVRVRQASWAVLYCLLPRRQPKSCRLHAFQHDV
jgi:hypothetical protein